jgi:hypothetical protein
MARADPGATWGKRTRMQPALRFLGAATQAVRIHRRARGLVPGSARGCQQDENSEAAKDCGPRRGYAAGRFRSRRTGPLKMLRERSSSRGSARIQLSLARRHLLFL